MKKYLLMVVALTIGVVAQAQIVTSKSSIVRKEKKTTWYFKPGFSVMTMGGDGAEDCGSKVGYNMDFGFQRTIKQKGAYWGMELGLGSRGFSFDTEYTYKKTTYEESGSAIAHNVQFSPFTFGWMVNLGCDGKLRLDPHIGMFASCDYTSKISIDDGDSYDWDDFCDNVYDVGMNLGVGIWYSRFNFDITWQRGFVDLDADNSDGAFKTNNVMFRIGVSF